MGCTQSQESKTQAKGNVLHISGSPRTDSKSTAVAAQLAKDLETKSGASVKTRDVSGLMPIDEHFTSGTFTAPDERSAEQKESLKLSDEIVAEAFDAKYLVLSTPMYNWNVTAGMKAWIDHVIRFGVTFEYVDGKPVGKLTNVEAAFVIVATGGVAKDSERDVVTPWMKTVLGHMGVSKVHVIFATGDDGVANANAEIESLLKKQEQ